MQFSIVLLNKQIKISARSIMCIQFFSTNEILYAKKLNKIIWTSLHQF